MPSQTVKRAKPDKIKQPRRLKDPAYRRGRYSKRIKHPGPNIISGPRIFKKSVVLIGKNKRLFGLILFIYLVLSILLVKGLAASNTLTVAKQTLTTGKNTSLGVGVNLLNDLVVSGSASTQTGSAYQAMLIVVMSLVVIWSLRQAYDRKKNVKVRVKSAFYNSTGSLIPFVLLLTLMSLQFVPGIMGGAIYSIVANNGLAASGIEHFAWASLFFVLVVFSFYMATSTIIALYIVTLPDVTPLKALRSSKELIRFRRWTVMRKIMFLPLALIILGLIIMLPVLLWLTPLAEWLFFGLGLAALIVIHAYLYTLYRELL